MNRILLFLIFLLSAGFAFLQGQNSKIELWFVDINNMQTLFAGGQIILKDSGSNIVQTKLPDDNGYTLLIDINHHSVYDLNVR